MTENTTTQDTAAQDTGPQEAGEFTGELNTELTPEQEDVLEALRDVVDPELGINVVDLGLVYGVDVDAERVATIDMTLTSAACPLTDVIEDQAREALEGIVCRRGVRRASPRTGASSSAPSASTSELFGARASDKPPRGRSGHRHVLM